MLPMLVFAALAAAAPIFARASEGIWGIAPCELCLFKGAPHPVFILPRGVLLCHEIAIVQYRIAPPAEGLSTLLLFWLNRVGQNEIPPLVGRHRPRVFAQRMWLQYDTAPG
jgi:hypothetical protein